jgi:hypothetical protein
MTAVLREILHKAARPFSPINVSAKKKYPGMSRGLEVVLSVVKGRPETRRP